MIKERLFIYQLFASLYRNGCNNIDISREKMDKLIPYLKCMLDEDIQNEISDLFLIDSNGIYFNCLEIINSLDPLFCFVQDNKVYLCLNDDISNLFFNPKVEYIGMKLAKYIMLREKVKVYHENN